MSWLNYPREFRLIEEIKYTSGTINFGVIETDIEYKQWNGVFIPESSENIIPFKMECDENFPSSEPIIHFTDLNNENVKQICDQYGKLNSSVLNWNKSLSIHDNLKKVYAHIK